MISRRATAGILAAALGLGGASAGCARRCTPSSSDMVLARSISTNLTRAVDGRDPSAAAGLYDKDAVLMPPGERPVRGQQAIQAYWQKLMTSGLRKVSLAPSELRMAGDIAYEIGEYGIDLIRADHQPGSESGKYIVLMRRQDDGSWKMTHDMWSPDAPDPSPPGRRP
jgi:uncharacterized protein (TIGR02246 family)